MTEIIPPPNPRPVFAIDFDGTMVEGRWPGVGRDLGSLFWLHILKEKGCDLVLWTCRHGESLDKAVAWLEEQCPGLFTSINATSPESPWESDPRKIFANVYVDDRALGAPVKFDLVAQTSWFDWEKAGPMLVAYADAYIAQGGTHG